MYMRYRSRQINHYTGKSPSTHTSSSSAVEKLPIPKNLVGWLLWLAQVGNMSRLMNENWFLSTNSLLSTYTYLLEREREREFVVATNQTRKYPSSSSSSSLVAFYMENFLSLGKQVE